MQTLLDSAFEQMKGQFDATNGGFGSAPKFPMGHNLSFLLRYYKHAKAPEALDMVKKTLTAMGRGGIWDHLGGGFHRYSTDQRWHIPHFEKMLYDQALLIMAYLEAHQATGYLDYEQTARETLDFVLREMTNKEGGFYSALDADSAERNGGHLKEGAFYVFAQSEIEEALGKDVAAVFNYCYGVLEQGNAEFDPHTEFKGKNILYLAHFLDEAGHKFHRPKDEIRHLLLEARAKLFSLRGQRPRPHTDDKVLCDWNGLMIAGFAAAGRVLDEPKYTNAAARAADFILIRMMKTNGLLHRWRDDTAGIQATLEDYSFFIYGLLQVHEATFQEKYLSAAKDLADRMVEFFDDDAGGGFYMTAKDAESLIIRPKEVYDGALPSGNSVAALILLKLHALTHQDAYLSRAKALFDCFASLAGQAPFAHCFLLSALDRHLQGDLEITFEGAENDPAVAKMLKVLYKYFIPSKAVNFRPASTQGRAQICYQGVCKAPVASVEAFEREISVL
jgi:uncharacterized protein YyaL (SSP411 family)